MKPFKQFFTYSKKKWWLCGLKPIDWHAHNIIIRNTFIITIASIIGIILFIDPYGVSPIHLPIKREIVDINQRYFYPMAVRSEQFDSFILGTSTSRLFNPRHLNKLYGGNFINLAMNSAMAWEQAQIAQLFIEEIGAPKTMIIGIDSVWCSRSADENRITFRGFPEWVYDKNSLNNIIPQLNLDTFEISARSLATSFGLKPPRVRFDGFEIFVPPESEYDIIRARELSWQERPKKEPNPQITRTAQEVAALNFPALLWMEELLQQIHNESRIVLLAVPVHKAALPYEGTDWEQEEQECKRRISNLASRYNADFIDYRFLSPLSLQDEFFWDNLHIRLPLATAIMEETVMIATSSTLLQSDYWKHYNIGK